MVAYCRDVFTNCSITDKTIWLWVPAFSLSYLVDKQKKGPVKVRGAFLTCADKVTQPLFVEKELCLARLLSPVPVFSSVNTHFAFQTFHLFWETCEACPLLLLKDMSEKWLWEWEDFDFTLNCYWNHSFSSPATSALKKQTAQGGSEELDTCLFMLFHLSSLCRVWSRVLRISPADQSTRQWTAVSCVYSPMEWKERYTAQTDSSWRCVSPDVMQWLRCMSFSDV